MNLVNEPVATYGQTGLDFVNYTVAKRLSPLLKWAGGKEQELKYIIPNLPNKFNDYYEPFVGGGAVYTAVQAENYFIKVC
ncbi:MAG: DNA adenine methylase [Flavobacterium sp.]|nr:DNA adenine methylase [Flavobacterium sp.]